jgi:hypothetical protein
MTRRKHYKPAISSPVKIKIDLIYLAQDAK